MGAYINPPNCTKEAWLETFGEPIDTPPIAVRVGADPLPVCLVGDDNFTAAAIAFDQLELNTFADPIDGRPKKWYMVRKDALLDVSNLRTYLK